MAQLAGLQGRVGRAVSRSVGEDSSVLCYAKWFPFTSTNAAGDQVTAATIQRLVNGLQFTVNGGAEVSIGTYTAASGTADQILYVDANIATIEGLIKAINGVAPGQPAATSSDYVDRWRGGLGDFRPQFPIDATSGIVVGAVNALLGRSDAGIAVTGDTSGLSTANLYSAGIGFGRTVEGGGQVIPDHFDSDYVGDTSGNRFPLRDAARRQEEQPGLARYTVNITSIDADMAYASDAKVVSIYSKDKLEGQFAIGAGTFVPGITNDTPFVGPAGSPLWVEVVGSGVLTNGPLSVSAEIRIA